MALNQSGLPGSDFEVVDYSRVSKALPKGVQALHGIVERGVVGKGIMVTSSEEYKRHFGGLLDAAKSNFPLYVDFMLKRRAPLIIVPAGHYTDPADAGTLVGTKATGTLTVSIDVVEGEAYSEGEWANGKLTVVITAAESGQADLLDIEVKLSSLPNYSQKIFDVKKAPNATELAALNAQLEFAKITSFTNNIPVGTINFSAGARDETALVTADYVGDSTAGTGIHAFGSLKNIVGIAVPEIADPLLDIAMINFVDNHKGIRAVLRTPAKTTGAIAKTYREGTGAYSHTPVDSWRGRLFYGDVLKDHPVTGEDIYVPAIVDAISSYAIKDNNYFPWFSLSGLKRGVIEGIDVYYDLDHPSRITEAGDVHNAGIIPVLNKNGTLCFWGGYNLWRKSQLIRQEPISEMALYSYRIIKPYLDENTFDPNDVTMWTGLFNQVNPELKELQDQRAISDYIYLGDQNLDDRSKVKVNNLDDLDAGKYIIKIFVKPIGQALWIGLQFGIVNSSVNLEEISQTANPA